MKVMNYYWSGQQYSYNQCHNKARNFCEHTATSLKIGITSLGDLTSLKSVSLFKSHQHTDTGSPEILFHFEICV
jgi:hypothetical protein